MPWGSPKPGAATRKANPVKWEPTPENVTPRTSEWVGKPTPADQPPWRK